MVYVQLEDLNNYPEATLHTNYGEITVALFPEIAPKAVKNFLELSRSGYYDGVLFHRVIPNFMIQGGDPTGTGCGGQSIYGGSFEDEFSTEAFNFYGALSMANAGPNTNGSQFFIVSAQSVPEEMLQQMKQLGWPEEAIATYQEKGGTPWLDQKHTVFGQVKSGMQTVASVESVARDARDKPKEPVIIEKVTIKEAE